MLTLWTTKYIVMKGCPVPFCAFIGFLDTGSIPTTQKQSKCSILSPIKISRCGLCPVGNRTPPSLLLKCCPGLSRSPDPIRSFPAFYRSPWGSCAPGSFIPGYKEPVGRLRLWHDPGHIWFFQPQKSPLLSILPCYKDPFTHSLGMQGTPRNSV